VLNPGGRLVRPLCAVAVGLFGWLGLTPKWDGGRLYWSVTPACADTISYAYDASGRLIQATDATTGQSVIYSYDSSGNITSRKVVPVTTLAVSGASADEGGAGTQITVYGTGFSTNAGSDVVTIGGVAATVVSATQTQLVVTVPSGSGGGVISVTVGASTASSASSFSTSGATAAPTISGFTPTIGAAGTTVTVSGGGFQTSTGNDTALLNGTWTSVTAATATTLTLSVPAQAGSGKISIATPFGRAVSAGDFVVPPTGDSASSIGWTGRTTIGSSATVSLPTAGQAGLLLFDGTKGALLAIGISGDTIASCTIKVFAPNGSLLTTSAAVTGSGQGVQIPALPSDGTYTVVVDSEGNSGAITLEIAGPVEGTLTQDGSAQPVTLSVPGQSALLSFSGTQGSYVSLDLTNVTISAGKVTVLTPSGSVLMSGALTTAGLSFSPQLPSSGFYTVEFTPAGSLAGSFSALLSTAAAATLVVDSTYSASLSGSASLTFRGASGQYLGLSISSAGGSIAGASVIVVNPDGSELSGGALTDTCAGNTCTGLVDINLGPLASTGTYTVQLQETSGGSGTLQIGLWSPAGGALSMGASQQVATSSGQPVEDTFSGTAGQYLGLSINAMGGSMGGASLTVLNPDGSLLTRGTLTDTCGSGCSGLADVNLGPLPSTGTYTVLVQETSGGGETLQIELWSPTGGALSIGASQQVATSSGQPVEDTFSGTAGQYLGLNISAIGGSMGGALITVLKPDGSPLAQGTLTDTCVSGCSGVADLNFGPLPSTGTYTVLVQETSGGSETLQVELWSPTGGALSIDTSQQVSTNSGQPVEETFSGTAGQYLGLNIDAIGGSLVNATVTVLKPDDSQLDQGTLTDTCAGNACSGVMDINLGPLPSTGTYTVLIQETSGGGETLQIELWSPAGGALSIGTSQQVSTNSGQPIEDTFSGTAGQYLSLSVSANGGSMGGALVTVLNPDGSQLTHGALTDTCAGNTCAGAASMTLGPLPATGVYTVLVQESAGGGASLSVLVSRFTTSTTLTSSSNPSDVGNIVTLTAKVTGGVSPTGTVSFSDGGSALGTATVNAAEATLSTSSLEQGTHSISASYSGDLSNLPSGSTVLSQQVLNQVPVTMTWIQGSGPPASVTVGVTISVALCITSSAAGHPGGTVTFLDGSTQLASTSLFWNSYESCSEAADYFNMPTPGSRTLVAQYSGDASNIAATLSTPVLVNNKGPLINNIADEV
jgi:YD repeat-containing protein